MPLRATPLFTLILVLTVTFAVAGLAQDNGTTASADAVTASTIPQYVFVPLGNNTGYGLQDRRMSEYRINASTGALTLLHKGLRAQNVAVFTFHDPSQRYLYVNGAARTTPSFSSNQISGYKVAPTTGAITALPGSPYQFGLQELAFGAIRNDLKFAYLLDFRSPSILHIVSMNPTTGAFTKLVATVEIPIGKTASFLFNMRFDSTGRYLYIADGEANLIDAYISNPATGLLTQVQGAPFAPRGSAPGSCSPRQNFCGGSVAVSGNHLYYVGQFYDGVAEFTINPNTGGLTELASSPVRNPAHGGIANRVTPNGKFLYVDAPGPNLVVGYSINQTTGKLTPVPGSPYAVPGQDFFMDVDRTGHFLYTNSGQTISGFRINLTSGALTKVPGSPYSASGNTGVSVVQ